MAHPVDGFVYRAFLLDIGVRSRHIGFGLVIIIVTYEILHGVVRKETLEFTIKLRRQNLVRRQDQRWPLHRFDDLGDGEGLARSGDAEQHLVALALVGLGDKLGNRGRLVACRDIIADDDKGLPAFGLFGPRRAMRHKAAVGVRFGEAGANLDFHGRNMGCIRDLF